MVDNHPVHTYSSSWFAVVMVAVMLLGWRGKITRWNRWFRQLTQEPSAGHQRSGRHFYHHHEPQLVSQTWTMIYHELNKPFQAIMKHDEAWISSIATLINPSIPIHPAQATLLLNVAINSPPSIISHPIHDCQPPLDHCWTLLIIGLKHHLTIINRY